MGAFVTVRIKLGVAIFVAVQLKVVPLSAVPLGSTQA